MKYVFVMTMTATAATFAGCNTNENIGDTECTAGNHCHLVDETPTCDEGYTRENPNDTSSLKCVLACQPDCTGRACGPDPVCGTSCGPCGPDAQCSTAGQCVADCIQDCSGRVCGPDPVCGLSCGTCAAGTCDAAGACEPDSVRCQNGVTLVDGPSYDIAEYPYSIHVTDLNNDKVDDLIVPNITNTSGDISPVTVLVGAGDGSFAATASLDESDPAWVASGDFDEDGKIDIAVVGAHGYSHTSVYPGKGDGTFLPAIVLHAGSYSTGVYARDFDGDTHLDLIVVSGDGVALFLGGGDMSFAGVVASQPLISNPVASALGNLNDDPYPDLVTCHISDGKIGILYGSASGVFEDPIYVTVYYEPRFVSLGDFNGDGREDAVVADRAQDRVAILLGQGGGTTPFSAPDYYDAGTYPAGVAAADLNGDGFSDVVVANRDDDTLGYFLANYDGSLQPQQTITVSGGPNAVNTGDFNGDGMTDVALGTLGGQKLNIFLGQCL